MRSILKVTTPAASAALLTTAELRDVFGYTTADNDAALAVLGLRAAASIAVFCNVAAAWMTPPTLLSEVLEEVVRLDQPREAIVLARRPVSAIGSISVDGVAVDVADFETDPSSAVIYRLSAGERSCWPTGKIVVAYTAGFSTPPDAVKLAAAKMVQTLKSEGERSPGLKREEIPGVITREWWVPNSGDPMLPAEVAELLAPFRNYLV